MYSKPISSDLTHMFSLILSYFYHLQKYAYISFFFFQNECVNI